MLTGPVTSQDLTETVTDNHLNASADGVVSGEISQTGGANASFGGIQTVTNSTGVFNANQSVTAVSSNSSITFGPSTSYAPPAP
jgi:hypothetical protein